MSWGSAFSPVCVVGLYLHTHILLMKARYWNSEREWVQPIWDTLNLSFRANKNRQSCIFCSLFKITSFDILMQLLAITLASKLPFQSNKEVNSNAQWMWFKDLSVWNENNNFTEIKLLFVLCCIFSAAQSINLSFLWFPPWHHSCYKVFWIEFYIYLKQLSNVTQQKDLEGSARDANLCHCQSNCSTCIQRVARRGRKVAAVTWQLKTWKGEGFGGVVFYLFFFFISILFFFFYCILFRFTSPVQLSAPVTD